MATSPAHSGKFLATTALEEFWDSSGQVLFLGEWCKLYSRRDVWQGLDHFDLPPVWKGIQARVEAYEYCGGICERTLEELTGALNHVHRISKSRDYYHQILGVWLTEFIHQAYDKYLSLSSAFTLHPECFTFVLDPEQYYIPPDDVGAMSHAWDDRYALQLYSEILGVWGRDFPVRRLSIPIRQPSVWHLHRGVRRSAYRALARLMRSCAGAFRQDSVTVTLPYFEPHALRSWLALVAAGGSRFVADDFKYEVKVPQQVDKDLRRSLVLPAGRDTFESIVRKIVLTNIPVLYLEGYAEFVRQVDTLPRRQSRVFHTLIGWYTNPVFRFYVAGRRDDVTLCLQQHGGGYGIDAFHMPEDYERSIADVFYTWGWSGHKARYLPHPKLRARGPIRASGARVLLTMTAKPRYVNRLMCQLMGSDFLHKYLDLTVAFCRRIDPGIPLAVRLHQTSEYQWCVEQRLRDSQLEFSVDGNADFSRSLEDSRICVFDHLATTYLESLAANKPTLIFIDPGVYAFRKDAAPYFERLQEARILHYSPDSAARHLNAVYGDMDGWWSSREVQSVREDLVNRYALPSRDWVDGWIREFESLSVNHRRMG
jgi:putative transferase (TIGR04331 family)